MSERPLKAIQQIQLGTVTRISPAGSPFLDLWAGHISVGAGWMIASIWAAVALAAGAIALRSKDV